MLPLLLRRSACAPRAAGRVSARPVLAPHIAAPVTPPLCRGLRDVKDDGVTPLQQVQHAYTTGNKRYMPGFSVPAPRKLEQIVKYALLERESPARIAEVWTDYHASRNDSVAAIWSKAEYDGIAERKRRCPRFVYPVLKPNGAYFTLFAEWQEKACIFTFLDDYRRDPRSAEPYMSLSFYDDFLARKQLVLVRADKTGHLTKGEAVHLLSLVRHFYFAEPGRVETFNLEPSRFDFAAHVRDLPRPPGGLGGA